MMWVCALLLSGVVDAATLKEKVSPVQKVLELLDDLKAKVEGDLAAEETLMDTYTKWCDEEKNEKDDAITSSTRTINELSASIEDATGSISVLTTEADELAQKISTAEADLSSATYIRDDERKSFEASESELVETVDTLGRAIVVLKRGQTDFLQSKTKSKELDLLATALTRIVSASWVTAQQKAKVQSLIQSEDEDLSLQPQATAAAYESKGSGILDTLGDLKDKAESSLSDQRKAEMEASHAYQMLKQSLETEIAQMNKRLAAATNERSQTEEGMHAAQEELEQTKKSKATDTTYLADLKQSCATKAAEWSERQKSASDELAVIAKAKEILSEGVKVFLQVSHKKRDDRVTSTQRDQITGILRKLKSKDHAYAFGQLALEVQSDTFGKVKGLISDMIDRLMKEAAEEADAKSFCDTEVSKSRSKQKDLSAKADMHSVRIEKASAAKAKLGEQIKALNAEVADIDAGQAEATAMRTNEKTEFDKASAEYSQSAEAVANAISVLQSYYANGAFVQVSKAPEFGSAKSDIGTTIVEMLEVAESDFTRLLAEATASENAAVAAYDKLTQANKVSRAAKVSEAEGKAGEVKSLDMSLLNYKDDRASTNKELDAVIDYLDKLKPQCETKVMSYAERKAAREQEISGLKEALAILEG